MTFYPQPFNYQESFKPPQDKLLVIGSGPSALMAKDLPLHEFDIVCMNNSWAAVPEPEKNIDFWYYSNDFYPRIEKHKAKGRVQMVPSPDLKRVLNAKSGAWKKRNIVDSGPVGCYFGSERHGGFVFINIMSLVFKTLEACDRWEEIWFLGCDHDYDGTTTHFYGDSEKVHNNDDDLLYYFRCIKLAADRLGIKLVIASQNTNGLLHKGFDTPLIDDYCLSEQLKYDWLYQHNYSYGPVKELFEFCKQDILTSQKIIDAGCGSQLLGKFLKEERFAGKILGIDISQELFNRRRYYPLLISSLEKIPFPKHWANCLFCCDVLEHVKEDQLSQIFSEFTRVVDPEGLICLSISTRPSFNLDKDGNNLHQTVKPPEWWIQLIEKNFVIKEIKTGADFLRVSARRR